MAATSEVTRAALLPNPVLCIVTTLAAGSAPPLSSCSLVVVVVIGQGMNGGRDDTFFGR